MQRKEVIGVYNIIEAHFYIKDNKTPMVFIKYHEDGAEKTVRLPTHHIEGDKAKEASGFIEGLLKSYESNKTGR